MKKILIATGGGDCPGLNAVIRGIVKAAEQNGQWEVWGSYEAFNGILSTPPRIIKLTSEVTAGIHVKGGTIIKTTNKKNPMNYPVQLENGEWTRVNICKDLVQTIKDHGFEAVVNIGGDGSQLISQELSKNGLNVVGVPKTIDNDLAGTDLTFGFSTAVQTATDSFDRLVTTAESHHRVIIMEVMGRNAGWIALHSAVAGGAEICIIPEIPYQIDLIVSSLKERYNEGRGFANIVIAEGAKPLGGEVSGVKTGEIGEEHIKLGGVGNVLKLQLENHPEMPDVQIRTTILGHVQRGGTPVAFDRILATAMGVKAFELIEEGKFGQLVSFRNNEITDVPLVEATQSSKFVSPNHYLVKVAKAAGISFGDT